MSDRTGTFQDEVSREIEVDGFKLEIRAHRIGEKGWALCVINELGVMSHWTDVFETMQHALEVANKTIETEGVKAFMYTGDFGYLLH